MNWLKYKKLVYPWENDIYLKKQYFTWYDESLLKCQHKHVTRITYFQISNILKTKNQLYYSYDIMYFNPQCLQRERIEGNLKNLCRKKLKKVKKKETSWKNRGRWKEKEREVIRRDDNPENRVFVLRDSKASTRQEVSMTKS